MIELRPKQVFQQHELVKKELATVVNSDNFKFSINFALAEYVSTSTPDSRQLIAVRDFISVLLNLPMPEERLPVFQTKTLDYSGPGVLRQHQPNP